MLNEKFDLHEGHEFDVEKYRAFKQKNALYLIMAVNGRGNQEISELEKISTQLQTFGDREVPTLLPAKDGEKVVEWEENLYSLLKYRELKKFETIKMGRKLARFHLRGKYMPFQVVNVNRVGLWKQLWERRLDQMESFWNGKLFYEPENEFEKMFFDSFPYYMGLAENAIQYLTDTELDEKPTEIDNGTVCHERFIKTTWGRSHLIKNPFDWVFDHCSRDLADWIRERYLYNPQTYLPEIQRFLAEYQQVTRLSPFAWRLTYARLLFPLHYFECIENYYITNSEQQKLALEDRLQKYLKQTEEHEQFLGRFYQLMEAPIRAYRLPVINWLMK